MACGFHFVHTPHERLLPFALECNSVSFVQVCWCGVSFVKMRPECIVCEQDVSDIT
jgi:hypothetical protein